MPVINRHIVEKEEIEVRFTNDEVVQFLLKWFEDDLANQLCRLCGLTDWQTVKIEKQESGHGVKMTITVKDFATVVDTLPGGGTL